MAIININEYYGSESGANNPRFESLDEFEAAILDMGYALPSDGLVEGRDYEDTAHMFAEACEKLHAAGYSVSNSSNEERIILAVSSDDDLVLESIRDLLGNKYAVAFTGVSNTDREGNSTDDVAISPV